MAVQVERADDTVAGARSSGLLRTTETVDAGAARLAVEARRADAALASVRTARASAQALQRQTTADLLATERRLAAAGHDLGTVRSELDRYVTESEAITGEPGIQVIAPGATDLWTVADHVVEHLTTTVLGGRASVRELDERLTTLWAELDALGVDGLLPPSADLRRVWDALTDAGIAATSGWQWLADKLDGPGRIAALERNPGLAGGVLLADAGRLDHARQVLADAGVDTTGVVVLGTAGDLDAEAPGSPAPVRPALYDPSWAQRERDERQAEAEDVTARLATTRAGLAVDEPLLDRVGDLLRRCPATTRSGLAGRVESTRSGGRRGLAGGRIRPERSRCHRCAAGRPRRSRTRPGGRRGACLPTGSGRSRSGPPGLGGSPGGG